MLHSLMKYPRIYTISCALCFFFPVCSELMLEIVKRLVKTNQLDAETKGKSALDMFNVWVEAPFEEPETLGMDIWKSDDIGRKHCRGDSPPSIVIKGRTQPVPPFAGLAAMLFAAKGRIVIRNSEQLTLTQEEKDLIWGPEYTLHMMLVRQLSDPSTYVNYVWRAVCGNYIGNNFEIAEGKVDVHSTYMLIRLKVQSVYGCNTRLTYGCDW
eukprot:GHVQ01028349.1.p1 GENE.GHVQ01028349.1~~GHVQ01028349.1.p1  ORF type:complete len:211 (+),score=19.31 GHVQ01028349.1:78-710(+)